MVNTSSITSVLRFRGQKNTASTLRRKPFKQLVSKFQLFRVLPESKHQLSWHPTPLPSPAPPYYPQREHVCGSAKPPLPHPHPAACGCGSKIGTQNDTQVNGTKDYITCSPIPGGFILTHTHVRDPCSCRSGSCSRTWPWAADPDSSCAAGRTRRGLPVPPLPPRRAQKAGGWCGSKPPASLWHFPPAQLG